MNAAHLRSLVAAVLILAGLPWTTTASGGAVPGGQGPHAPVPAAELFFRYSLTARGDPVEGEVAVQVPSPLSPADLDQVVSLPTPLGSIRLTRYLPQARKEQRVIPDESKTGRPCIQVSIDGPTQSHQRWLVAGDDDRNRLTSFIGTWRYVPSDNGRRREELYRQFETELTREPKLYVSRANGDGVRELPLEIDVVNALRELDCKVRVLRFYPNLTIDPQTQQPVNTSDQRLNPAALVEIEHKGKKEERWVFARFADFKMHETDTLPVNVKLDCPMEVANPVPDFVVVAVKPPGHELWSRHAGVTASRVIALKEAVPIPGSQYTFHLAKFAASGRLVETYEPTDGREAVSALQIEIVDATGKRTTVWLELGRQRIVRNVTGPLAVEFATQRKTGPGPGH